MPLYIVPRAPVLHAGVRLRLHTDGRPVTLRLSGRTHFIFFVDGEFYGDGPSRFASHHPEYTDYPLDLPAGEHVVAVLLQYLGFDTRLADSALPPFLYAACADADGAEVPISAVMQPLGGYDNDPARRVAPILGLMEWCDRRGHNPGWMLPGADDSGWMPLAPSDAFALHSDPTRPVLHLRERIEAVAGGTLTEQFGYERDFPQVRFVLRRLDDAELPPQGIWRRYDLGMVKLGRPRFVLDVPPGTTVEFALCEQLTEGRVHPFISLCLGPSANMVHFTAAGGGPEEFFPVCPLGGRFVELHIIAPAGKLDECRILEEGFVWRTFFDEPVGAFCSEDALLNRIWQLGVDTLRCCTEDVVTDCPVRERGQWTGDSSMVGLRTAAYAYGDLQAIRKSLRQAARVTDADGVLPALYPSRPAYFVTYSLLWVRGCMDYYRATGDVSLLREILPAADTFMDFMARSFCPEDGSFCRDGQPLDWGFVDWGYAPPPGGPNLPAVGMYHMALRAFIDIKRVLGYGTPADERRADAVHACMARSAESRRPDEIGLHGLTFLLLQNVLDGFARIEAIAHIEDFILDCFPNQYSAPRLSAPDVVSSHVITPYFLNFTLWALMECGETAFVYGQLRTCWGYMLDRGNTTCLEVFDPRWSHCHQWSGCPTWLLSHYALGLSKRYDLGVRHLEWTLRPGPLKRAHGRVPFADGGGIDVSWEAQEGGKTVRYVLRPDAACMLHLPGGETASCPAGEERVLELPLL